MPRGSKLQSECAGSQVVKRKKPDIADPPPPTSTIGKEILAKVTAKDNSILVDKDGGYFWTAAALKAVPISDLLNELRPHWESMASVLRDHDLLTVTNNFTNATQKRVRNKGNWLKQDHPTDAATRKKDSEIEKALTAIVEETRGMLRNSKGQIVLPVYPDFCIFALSGFVESLSEILRNDSLTDISCRSELYHRVFELVKTCSSSNDFAELFCTSSEDNGTPIASLLATMNEQANVFLHSKQQVEENADDSEMIISIDISMSIRDSIESISESNHQMKQKIENIEEKYIARLTPHRLRMVSMWDVDTQRYNHAYNKELRSSKKAVGSAAARMKEFSTLTTALPVSWGSGIFIRVDEGRNDCLKALIIGPEGTPYQNGCFMFDIFLPSQYPQVPPKVTLTTTSGGKIRFNPNLYASGKVCLSLLGTWQGPSWIPGKSTLLQVLISIQGLILVKDPMDNEPGVRASSKEHSEFNRYMRYFTCKGAMLEVLESNNTLFGEVILEHFKLKKETITKDLTALKSEATRLRKAPPATYGFPHGAFGAGDDTSPTSIVDLTLQKLKAL